MEQLLTFFDNFTILTLVKMLAVILMGVYGIFAGLMAIQIKAMTKAITMKDDYVIQILGILHLIFAILVFLMAVFIL
jgi:hypothetical protein